MHSGDLALVHAEVLAFTPGEWPDHLQKASSGPGYDTNTLFCLVLLIFMILGAKTLDQFMTKLVA